MKKKKNKIAHTEEKYGIRPQAREFPMMAVLSFVYVCNARCPNCPYTNSAIRADYKDRPFMRADTFKMAAPRCPGKLRSVT